MIYHDPVGVIRKALFLSQEEIDSSNATKTDDNKIIWMGYFAASRTIRCHFGKFSSFQIGQLLDG